MRIKSLMGDEVNHEDGLGGFLSVSCITAYVIGSFFLAGYVFVNGGPMGLSFDPKHLMWLGPMILLYWGVMFFIWFVMEGAMSYVFTSLALIGLWSSLIPQMFMLGKVGSRGIRVGLFISLITHWTFALWLSSISWPSAPWEWTKLWGGYCVAMILNGLIWIVLLVIFLRSRKKRSLISNG